MKRETRKKRCDPAPPKGARERASRQGKTTDYVARQYIGNLGKTEKGIVSVNAYAVVEAVTYPLLFKVFKPKTCLHKSDEYKTKPQLAQEIIKELRNWGFRIKLVLADSL